MKLVILDRDGVINEDSDEYIKSADEWIPLPGSIEAIARLYRAGYQVVVATNQSGLGRGYFSLHDLEAMHGKFRSLVAAAGGQVAGIYYCPHTPEDHCNCRKPEAGLLDQIANTFGCKLHGVPLVGDNIRDLQAGMQRDCELYLVRTGKGVASEAKLHQCSDPGLQKAIVFDNLSAVTDYLLGKPE